MPFAHGKPVPVRPDPVRRGLPALVRAAHVSPAPARRWRHRQQRSRPDLFRPHGSSAIAARRAATPFASAGSALQSLRALNGGPRLSPLSTALSSFLRSSRTKAPSLHPRYQVSPLSGRRRRPAGLTSVRLSNGSYSFPVSRFHEGLSKKKMRGSYRCRCSRRLVPATALARGRLVPAVYPPVSGPSRYPLDPSMERVSSAHEARVFHLSFRDECQAFFAVVAGMTDEFCACPTRSRRRACCAGKPPQLRQRGGSIQGSVNHENANSHSTSLSTAIRRRALRATTAGRPGAGCRAGRAACA